ncbi:unnamed protein product [Spirodela intermedia]|uniref:Uncharacterized protein n=2 Tax=Spirodela intermedia TaxID=51605 RepID=A0A7I8IFG5_SPIIN|nr:unnamed protein product [Spirodela intermedia]CAA6656568.1 unnamed protein product [Spirodela intermedia]CAA7392163.1 unnamed protein product [Spirodela intermedia]
MATHYHMQANGQVELSNRKIKKNLKKIIWPNGKDWAEKLLDALWTYRTTFKNPIGMSLFCLIYGKAYHLLVEIEH